MPAEPLRAPGPEAEQPPAPAAETPRPASLNEVLTGIPTPEAPAQPESLRETEDRLAREGMAKLNEMGKNFNTQAEAGIQEFKEETKSWWGRAKDKFKKKEDAPVKGEQDVLREIEEADEVFKNFRKKAAEIMVSGDEAGLRMLERSLSKTYDELAPQVAAEGAAEAGAMKKALKTGEMPQITETGAKLNYVAKRLADVRGKLNAGAPAAGGREASLRGGEVVGVDVGTRQMRDGTTEGVVTTTYADGRERVETSSGRDLVGIPGGLAETAEAPAEGSEENPILLTPEMRLPSTEGVVSGATESKPEPSEPPQAESVVVSPEAHVSSALEKVTKELDGFDFDEAKESMLLNFRIGAEVGKNTVEGWKKKRAAVSSDADFKKTLSEEYDIPIDEIDAIPAADLATQHERMLSAFDRLIEAGESEMKKASVKTSEQAPVASGEIVNSTVLQKVVSSSEAPTASGEIAVEESDIVEALPAAEAAPAQESAPVPMQEAAPAPAPVVEAAPAAAEITEAQMAKAKEHPLAPESMAAIVDALKLKGKLGDGKFSTPAPFMDALGELGFKLPSDMESEDPKKLHTAYKKATAK